MAVVRYLDFDLLLERAGEGYRARVLDSPGGQAETDFRLPFTTQDLEIFVLRVGRTRRGVRRIDSPEMQAAKTFGGQLFEAVFANEVRGCLRSSLDEATRQGMGLRLRLRLNDTPELVELPWEFLYYPALNRFLALSVKTPLVRYLEIPERIRPLALKPPLRVLTVISSPSDYEPLAVEREWAKLQDAVRDLMSREAVVLDRLETATLAEVRRRLRQNEYHVLHFIGHGGFDSRLQDGVLVFESEEGRGRPLSGQELGTLLTNYDSLRVAILNACEGARTSTTDPFAGVASSLVQQGIPAVIAMQFEITDRAAITFAHEFYAALADNYPLDAALAEARQAIMAEGNDVEWGTPVLYLRAPDGVIFVPPSPEELAQAQRAQAERARQAQEQEARRLTEARAEEERLAREKAQEEEKVKKEEAERLALAQADAERQARAQADLERGWREKADAEKAAQDKVEAERKAQAARQSGLLLEGQQLFAAGRYREAAEAAAQILTLDPAHAEALALRLRATKAMEALEPARPVQGPANPPRGRPEERARQALQLPAPTLWLLIAGALLLILITALAAGPVGIWLQEMGILSPAQPSDGGEPTPSDSSEPPPTDTPQSLAPFGGAAGRSLARPIQDRGAAGRRLVRSCRAVAGADDQAKPAGNRRTAGSPITA